MNLTRNAELYLQVATSLPGGQPVPRVGLRSNLLHQGNVNNPCLKSCEVNGFLNAITITIPNILT